jgi:ribonuclease R
LIEEAMIAANVCAAEFIEKHEALALYRVHGQPDVLKVQMLRSAFAMAGVHLAKEITPHTVQAALEQIAHRPDAWIFQMLALRAMQQAVYQPGNIGHFGLALTHYMHFTSPIRRYADLLVHRAIKAILHGKKTPLDEPTLADIGVHISFTERRAESAERAVDTWLKCDLVGEHVGEEMSGRIGGVTEFGLFVELEGYYVQGLVHISELGQDYFRYQPHAMALVGDRSGQSFRIGDPVRVLVREVRPALGRIDLELVQSAGKRRTHPEGDDRRERSRQSEPRGRHRRR